MLIGVASTFQSKKSNQDYLLAGHNIHPWLSALSAVATNNSGYMFIGMIGYTYMTGLESLWLMVGWIFGDMMISGIVHKKLREKTEQEDLLSYGGVLSRWHGTNFKKLRFIVGVITILFLGVYAAAQFKAGSKALHVLFGWNYSTGAIIGSVIVLIYCYAGGIRASIWTDAAQSIVMIAAMALLFLYGVDHAGGWTSFVQQLHAVDPNFMTIFPSELPMDNTLGISLFIIGWFFGGFGVIGQPHVMIRFMAVDSSTHMNRTRIYYYSWYTLFSILTIGVGLCARLILPESGFDAELALPLISKELFPSILIGVVLAGIFSATMSTADSQILSCSSAFTRDILPKEKSNLKITKLITVVVTLIALTIALSGKDSVFSLVLVAWSVLSSAFGPLLFVYALDKKVSERTGILMILGGTAGALIWRQLGLGGSLYEVAPGMLTGLLIYGISVVFQWNPTVQEEKSSLRSR